MSTKKPRILLIGAGRFGFNYIRIFKDLHSKGEIDFVGVCVSTESNAARLRKEQKVFTTTNYQSLLTELDAVCIVTPPESHYKIVSDCISHVHVLCEKPLALSVAEVRDLDLKALKSDNKLMIAQLFRFDPVTSKMKGLIKDKFDSQLPKQIDAVFVNPENTYIERPVAFEFNHWFDLTIYLFPFLKSKSVKYTSSSSNKRKVKNVDVQYVYKNTICNGNFVLGWSGKVKDRTFSILYEGGDYISADYISQTINVYNLGERYQYTVEGYDSLEKEVKTFVSVVNNEIINPIPPDSIVESVKIAEQVRLV